MLSQNVMGLVENAVKDGYEEARNRIPFFTDRIFLWVRENKSEEAFTQFLASFVEAAIADTVELLESKFIKKEEDGKTEEQAG